ncbi:hypothetical protein MMC21_005673 [Puttea exsequens]|nr:hypothetical protein [Puttea exsequens]
MPRLFNVEILSPPIVVLSAGILAGFVLEPALAYIYGLILASCVRVKSDGPQDRNNGAPTSTKCDIDNEPELDALVVGAGWAGLWACYKLKKQGLRVRLVEASPDVGGVWYYSRYPGCRNDTEVPLYEYSDPKLWQEWNWSERFPAQPEIYRYLYWVSEKLNVREDMQFNTRINAAHWDEQGKFWRLYTKDGPYARARFFLPCSGYTTIKYIPQYKGALSFKHAYHTSEWPSGLSCKGKRVGVVGNAASGIQVIEAISSEVSHLTVFQRTPNLATPMAQEKYTAESMAELKKDYPRRLGNRVSRNGYDVPPRNRCTFEDTPEERREFYESLWARGGLAFWMSNYKDLLTSSAANTEAYNFWRLKVRARIEDPIIADHLAPSTPPHPFGTKRPSLETRYFEVFNQPNVRLINLSCDAISEITPRGITTSSGQHHDLDIIVFATGFDFLVGSILAMGIRGVNGLSINSKWDITPSGSGVWTHLGLMTSGFPNMFFPMGPQAPSALGLTPQMAEVQGDWIAGCVAEMRARGKGVIEAGAEAERGWKREVRRAAEENLMGRGDSWYLGVNIPGRKREALCYFGGVDRYIRTLQECAKEGYTGFNMF